MEKILFHTGQGAQEMSVSIFYFLISFEHSRVFWCHVILGLMTYNESQGDPWPWVT